MLDIVRDDTVAVIGIRAGDLHGILEIGTIGAQGIVNAHVADRQDIMPFVPFPDDLGGVFFSQIFLQDIGKRGHGNTRQVETAILTSQRENPP